MKEDRSRRARGSHPSTREDFETVKGVSTLTDSGALRGASFEGGLGRPDADERRLHVARPTEAVTRTLEGFARGGELAFISAALRSSPSAHMNPTIARWRSEARATAPNAGAVRLPTWIHAARRAPSGNRRKTRNAEEASTLPKRARIIRSMQRARASG